MITKEDLVAEGWKLTDQSNPYYGNNVYEFGSWINYGNSDMRLWYELILCNNGKVWIEKHTEGGFTGAHDAIQIYDGKCEDTATLILLQDLLGIKKLGV